MENIQILKAEKADLSWERFGKKPISLEEMFKKLNISSKEEKLEFLKTLVKKIGNKKDRMVIINDEFYLGTERSMRDHTPWVFNPCLAYYTPNTGIGAQTKKWYQYTSDYNLIAGMHEYTEANSVHFANQANIKADILSVLIFKAFYAELNALILVRRNGMNIKLKKEEFDVLTSHFSTMSLVEKHYSEVSKYGILSEFI